MHHKTRNVSPAGAGLGGPTRQQLARSFGGMMKNENMGAIKIAPVIQLFLEPLTGYARMLCLAILKSQKGNRLLARIENLGIKKLAREFSAACINNGILGFPPQSPTPLLSISSAFLDPRRSCPHCPPAPPKQRRQLTPSLSSPSVHPSSSQAGSAGDLGDVYRRPIFG